MNSISVDRFALPDPCRKLEDSTYNFKKYRAERHYNYYYRYNVLVVLHVVVYLFLFAKAATGGPIDAAFQKLQYALKNYRYMAYMYGHPPVAMLELIVCILFYRIWCAQEHLVRVASHLVSILVTGVRGPKFEAKTIRQPLGSKTGHQHKTYGFRGYGTIVCALTRAFQ